LPAKYNLKKIIVREFLMPAFITKEMKAFPIPALNAATEKQMLKTSALSSATSQMFTCSSAGSAAMSTGRPMAAAICDDV